MKISSAAIKDGNFEDKYGAKGTDFANKLPALSIPFEISEVPITAESFVVILADLPLKEGFSEKELKEAMRGHVISEALVSGMYSN